MKKVALIILDGWGIGDGSASDAIANANTPFIDSLYKKYPYATLRTSGHDVGLPEGQMGNSEVGHLNLGAGRVVYQDLALINKEVEEKKINQKQTILDAFRYALENKKNLHFIGLVSEGGVHSSLAHLKHLCTMASEHGLRNFFIHAFTDGRDCDPKSGHGYILDLEEHLKSTGGTIASLIGRYYAMDRDQRWERIKLAYDLLLYGKGRKTKNIALAVEESYLAEVTDEFIQPIVRCEEEGEAIGSIKEGDVVFCFNFRTDRCREITEVLTQKNMPEFDMQTLPLYYLTLTNYDSRFKNIHVVYDKADIRNTIGEVISLSEKKQLRIAETEKYPHVTFFFSGGREKEFRGEKRIMIPSPKVATYDLQPEMSAVELTEALLTELKKEESDFICLNFANADMVGHTGQYAAVIKAVETVDACTRRIVEIGLKHAYSFLIIADHGNSDYMINSDGTPNTAHTTNPVPLILVDDQYSAIRSGKLADIAPTILFMLGLPIPDEMDGKVLIA